MWGHRRRRRLAGASDRLIGRFNSEGIGLHFGTAPLCAACRTLHEREGPDDPSDSRDLLLWARRDSNSLPPASERGIGRQQAVAGASKAVESLRSEACGSGNDLDQEAPFRRSFGPPVVQGNRLLTAREVAAVLRVCTATVYRLCAKNALEHNRISNAVRVPADAVVRFLRATDRRATMGRKCQRSKPTRSATSCQRNESSA
jgi:excisionase family DNA binding protein